MNPEIKEQWIAALESGEYAQGRQALERNGRFCCLGVLCDLAAKQGVVERHVIEVGDFYLGMYGDSQGNCDGYLPLSVAKWAGLTDGNPSICLEDGLGEFLSILNDNGSSFHEIALLIKEHL